MKRILNVPCCGCNLIRIIKTIKRETVNGYMKRRPLCVSCGHKKRLSKMKHGPNWKGGEHVDCNGYVRIRINNGYVKKHRYVWEQHNGKIPYGMVIHHKDGNKLNNNIDNLECLDKITHDKLSISLKINHYNRRIKRTENLLCAV